MYLGLTGKMKNILKRLLIPVMLPLMRKKLTSPKIRESEQKETDCNQQDLKVRIHALLNLRL